MLTTPEKREKLKTAYEEVVDYQLRKIFESRYNGLGNPILARELGSGINSGDNVSRLERRIISHNLHAVIRRERISRAIRDYRDRYPVNAEGSFLSVYPEAEYDESDQNIETIIALDCGVSWLSIVIFYMKTMDDSHTREIILRRDGVEVVMPSLMIGNKPSSAKNSKSSVCRYFPDAPGNTYDWRRINETSLDMLSLATGFTPDQLQMIFESS